MNEILQRFSQPTQAWFAEAFDAPSPPQELGWPAIANGQHTLITAPTGSGKTLAAFLWCLDCIFADLQHDEVTPGGIHTLYISPLKALNYDVERNLKEPLAGIQRAARDLGQAAPRVRVAVRTGDTPSSQRSAMLRRPPHVLITTPESLFILLTSPRAREVLATLRYVIVDEVHALCGNKRGCNLTLCLERLERLCGRAPVRIGLSATIRPREEASLFLGGRHYQDDTLQLRPVTFVDAGLRKELDVKVQAPVADYTDLLAESLWPQLYPTLLEQIKAHKSTLIFLRMRAQAERVSRALNELAQEGAPGEEGEEAEHLTRPHHSSISAELRREVEELFKEGRLPALLSTGTMELGIDVGAINLVLQLNSPGSVSAGLQRVGRAGHLLGARSKGRIIPLYREDLVECAVLARHMLQGRIEPTTMPRNALDVVAQHVVSEVAMGPCQGSELLALFRQAGPYGGLTREPLDTVLSLLAGRYPAEVSRGLAAKLTWERSTDKLTPHRGARMLAVTAGGTIPDSGYYKLQLADGTRLGELEEEFVYERSVGEAIAMGGATWRILDIGQERVVVAPAPGQPAVVPFWKGGLFGRDAELSQAIGAFREELYQRVEDPRAAEAWLLERFPVDRWSAANLVRYFGGQRIKGHPVGTHRRVVVEANRDEMGDYRLVLHACFGNRVNAPLALALRRQIRQRMQVEPLVMSDDNAILVRLPEGDAPPPMDLLQQLDPDRLEEMVLQELSGSAMFGALFRHNAGRFLVLGHRGPGRRNPLWLQRLRAKDLQEATREMPDFPARLETFRQCLQDMFDLPRAIRLLLEIAEGEVEVLEHHADTPSPVASGLLYKFEAQYMYEYDEPRAERSMRRLQVDRQILDRMLQKAEMDGLLLPQATAELQGRWQGSAPKKLARDADELLALVLRLALLPLSDLGQRCAEPPGPYVDQLIADGRLARFDLQPPADGGGDTAATPWVCATEDLPLVLASHGRDRVRLESPPPEGREPLSPDQARRLLLLRVLDNLGPVMPEEVARRCGLSLRDTVTALDALRGDGRVVEGKFHEDSTLPLVCTRANLEQIRRRSLGLLRQQIEPLSPATLQKLVLQRQRLDPAAAGGGGALWEVLGQLAGRALPAETLERDLLPSRLQDYRVGMLDDLVAGGELLWTGAGLCRMVLLQPGQPGPPPAEEPLSPDQQAIHAALRQRGASFMSDVCQQTGMPLSRAQRGLWQLVWAGQATNDRLESLRRGMALGFEPAAPADPAKNIFSGRPSSRRRSLGRGHRNPMRAGSSPWAGRWAMAPEPAAPTEETATAYIWQVVGRYGVVCRELLALEVGPAWSELYPLLCQLELCGDLRRGVFVHGLSAAQFAPAALVDQLRALRDEPQDAVMLNACDPAFVAGALGLPFPGDTPLPRRPGNYVVLEDGLPMLAAEGLGRRLQLDPNQERWRSWLSLLAQLPARGHKAVRVEQVDGVPVLDSPARPLLEDLGFSKDGKALERRRFS